MTFPGLLLDWVGLRIPLSELPPTVTDFLFRSVTKVVCANHDMSELMWEQNRYAYDTARSDSCRIFYTVRWIGPKAYLYIGGSPATLEHGNNVFGGMDVVRAAEWVIYAAQVEFKAFLPPPEAWECVRLDVTGNYVLPDAAAVKVALRQLAVCDGARRKASNVAKGGDTVMWSATSDLLAGKGYHKGPHLEHLMRTAPGRYEIESWQCSLASRLLRLEMRMGSRWFRRLRDEKLGEEFKGKNWTELTPELLASVYCGFFEPLVGGQEVTGMERVELEKRVMAGSGCTAGQARSALGTYRAIKEEGYEAVKASMSERTFYRHKKMLTAAGITEADLVKGNVFAFKPVRIILAQPVSSWDELRRAA